MKKKIIFGIIFLVLIAGITTATISNISLNLSLEDKDILERVGKGIGEIEKERTICDELGECVNETYTDHLQLQEKGCDTSFCYFKLYEDGGINKDIQVNLKQVCETYGICKDLEFGDYECCLNYRDLTEDEILINASKEVNEILNKIIRVTLAREEKAERNKRFEDIEVVI